MEKKLKTAEEIKAQWPDEVRLKMIEKSEFYGEPQIYQYGFYDGYQLAYHAQFHPMSEEQMRLAFEKYINQQLQSRIRELEEDIKHWIASHDRISDENKKYLEKTIQLQQENERLKEENEWINIDDKMPVVWGDYLVTTGNWVGSCHYDGEFYDYSVHKMKESSRYKLPVSHWRYLPKAPK